MKEKISATLPLETPSYDSYYDLAHMVWVTTPMVTVSASRKCVTLTQAKYTSGAALHGAPQGTRGRK